MNYFIFTFLSFRILWVVGVIPNYFTLCLEILELFTLPLSFPFLLLIFEKYWLVYHYNTLTIMLPNIVFETLNRLLFWLFFGKLIISITMQRFHVIISTCLTNWVPHVSLEQLCWFWCQRLLSFFFYALLLMKPNNICI